MRSRLLTALLAISLSALPAAAAAPPRIVIDHRILFPAPDSQPFIQNGRTLVPLRAIFEYLGATVEWDGATQTITARKGETVVILQVDAPTAIVDGKQVTLDQPAVLVGGRTFVPLRLVSEAFGATVTWFESTAPVDWMSPMPIVGITTKPLPAERPPLTFTPAPAALQKRTAAKGQALIATDEGIGFLDLSTGQAESYAIPGAEPRTAGYSASPDGRFVIARGIETGYLLDRQSGQVQSWDHRQYELIVAGKEHLLFQAMTPNPAGWVTDVDLVNGRLGGYLSGTGRFIVTDSDLRPVADFTLPEPTGRPVSSDEALFNPEETQMMLSWGRNAFRIDLGTGAGATVGTAARLLPAKGGAEVIALRTSERATLVTRFDWDLKLMAESRIPAERVKLSSDGEWVAWEVMRDHFTPAVYFARLGEAERPYQALGASICYGSIGSTGARWLPGASGPSLLVNTREGLRTISVSGSVQGLIPPAGFDYYDPEAAPGTEPAYSFRRWTKRGNEVGAITPEGEIIAAVALQSPNGQIVPSRYSPLWGASPDEVRFTLIRQLGTGGPCGDYAIPLPMRLYAPGTYSERVTLQVVAPDDGVYLRAEPSFAASVIKVLPSGSRIELSLDASSVLPSLIHNEDGQWFQLPEGWIRVDSGLVQFAP